MTRINSRIKKIEVNTEESGRIFTDYELYLLRFKNICSLCEQAYPSARPACSKLVDGECVEWFVKWNHLHILINMADGELRERFDSEAEAQEVIDYMYKELMDFKPRLQQELEAHNLIGVNETEWKRQSWYRR